MKRMRFLLSVLLPLLWFGCQDQQVQPEVENAFEEEQKSSIQKVMQEFFTIDSVKYQQLRADENFVELCGYYDEMEKRILQGITPRLQEIESRKWFSKMNWAITDYQCDNLFAYILEYLNGKKNLSRISHAWGVCYYYGIFSVCDTYKRWQDFWELNYSFEQNAAVYMGNNMNLKTYRESCLEYWLMYDGARYSSSYCSFFKNEVALKDPLHYFTLKNWPLNSVVNNLKYVYQVPDDDICFFIGEWETSLMRFYNSQIWSVNHIGIGLYPSHGDWGGGLPGSSSIPISPEMGEVIDSSSLKGDTFINCAFSSLQSKSTLFNRMIKEFRDSNSIAHLRYRISNELPEGTNGRLVSNMENYWLTILLNKGLGKQPPLAIAKTIIHETIHAHITMQLLNVQDTWGKANLSSGEFSCLKYALEQEDYPTLYYYYDKYKVHVTSQHQYMAEYYVPFIADILYEISGESYNICEAIAWQGLKATKGPSGIKDTEAWKNLSQTKRDEINGIYNNYLVTKSPKCLD